MPPKNSTNGACAPQASATAINYRKLQEAVKKERVDAVRALALDGDPSVVLKAAVDETRVLCVASKMGNLELVRYFVEEVGASLEVRTNDEFSSTPLHCAAYQGQDEVVAYLLAKRSPINALDANLRTPLMVAIMNYGKVRCRGPVNEYKLTSLYLTCLQLLRYNTCDPNATDPATASENDPARVTTALHYACHYGMERVVAALLARLPRSLNPLNADDATPLMLAIEESHLAIVELLLNAMRERDQSGALERAALGTYNKGGWGPIHCAVNGGSNRIIEVLLRHGADRNMRTAPTKPGKAPKTPLQLADQHSREVRALLGAQQGPGERSAQ